MTTRSLEISELSCARGDRTLFAGFSARVGGGELLYVAGSNGSGKTTLLRTICGLARPALGDIRWGGQSTRLLGDEFRRCFSYVGHHDGVQGELTPVENLRAYRCVVRSVAPPSPLPLSRGERPPGHVIAANYAHEPGGLFPHPLPSPEGRGGVGSLARFMGRGTTTIDSGVDHFNKILDRLGLTPYRSFPAKILSQGQRRRLALARLLVADKPLWIMDEPFTALDVRSCRLISELLAQHLARGGMAIISSHQEFDIAGTAPSRIDLDALRTPSPYQWNDAGSAQPASAGQYPT